MKKSTKFTLFIALLALLFGTVWYMNERDAERQLQELIAEREASVELIQKVSPSGFLFAPDTEAHQNLMYWGYDGLFKTVELNDREGLWYLHQNWTNWPLKRNTLSAHVDEHGALSLVSHFIGEEAFYHNQVLVKIGNTVYDSTFIPHYTKAVAQKGSRQQVQEMNTYTASKDQDIVREIALTKDQTIQVLIKGKEHSISFDLPPADHQAIVDCYRLAQRILQG